MVPQISIIIPVYNVEPYLRECLDSVVNQTMREIQIICVNDGSTDGSFAILEAYAACDSRIEIINKPNGGLSAARNVAYPYVKGEYTLFVDSDDWIHRQLCEKVWKKAHESCAELVLFSHVRVGTQPISNGFSEIIPDDKVSCDEKKTILHYPMAWAKLWKTDFLLNKQIFFPEGLYFEDNLTHWQAVLQAEKISILPEELYYYRQRENSITQSCGREYFDLFEILQRIEQFLKENGYYDQFKEYFIIMVIGYLQHHYLWIKDELKPEFSEKLKNSLGDAEMDYLRNDCHIDPSIIYFYYQITGNRYLFLRYVKWRIRSFFGLFKRCIIRQIVRKIDDILKLQKNCNDIYL
ncbi:MAG: glycosyltransferase [Planctomycetaceae bacterium]|nr:glycosyltransferase [Planctomycetaceae bacterium]